MTKSTTTVEEQREAREAGILAGQIALANGVRYVGTVGLVAYARSQGDRLRYADPEAYARGFCDAYNGWA